MRRKIFSAAVAAGAVIALPVAASAGEGGAATAERVGAPSAAGSMQASVQRTGTPSATDDRSVMSATLWGDGILNYRCGGGAIGVTGYQIKNGPAINGFRTIHQLQRFNGAGFQTVASKSYVKASPLNGVKYYSPGPGVRLSWIPATAGVYRINLVFKFYRNGTLVLTRSLNTQRAFGSVCVFH